LNKTTAIAGRAHALGVHLLGADQLDVAVTFGSISGDRVDKLSAVQWRSGNAGAPILENCSVRFEGGVVKRIRLGDHIGYVLEPLDVGEGPRSGAMMRTAIADLKAGHPAEEVAQQERSQTSLSGREPFIHHACVPKRRGGEAGAR
jgi:flavin reductase (DIM6/NTAB) family NADH-FMN oxidoreductase RutF